MELSNICHITPLANPNPKMRPMFLLCCHGNDQHVPYYSNEELSDSP